MSESGKAIFLSYASQDAEAAKKICDALRAAGVEVWFDQNELVGGDAWDQKIRGQIANCALFIPIISANTQARLEGYFRLEWKLAALRTHTMADEKAFLLPVTIDDTRDAEAKVPAEFKAVQWTRLRPPGFGESSPQEGEDPVLGKFAARVKKLLSGEVAGVADPGPGSTSPATVMRGQRENTGGIPRWARTAVALIGAVCGLLIAIYAVLQRREHSAPVAVATPSDALVVQAKALIDDDPLRVRENYRTAVELCARATALSPDDAEAWATGARATTFLLFHYNERSDKQVAAARSQAERAMRLAPDSIESGLAMAFFDAVAGAGPDVAERRLRVLHDREPKERRILELLALIAGDVRENIDECRQWAERADALPGGSPLALEQLAWAYWGANRFPELEQVLARIFARQPTSVAYHLKLMLLRSSDDLDGVLVWLDKTPAAVLAEDRVVSLAVEVYQMKGQTEKALALLGRIPREFLEEGRYLAPKSYLVGQLLQASGKTRAAEVQFRAALKAVDERIAANPHDGELFNWRGRVLVQLGDKAEAAKQFATGRELGADSTVNVDAADEVMLGNHDAAIATADRKLQRQRSRWPSFFIDLKYSSAYDPLRGDPRFQALLARGQAWLDEMRTGSAKPLTETAAAVPAPASPLLAPSSPLPVDSKSIAVLAFANLSDDKANEYFSDGISEELLNVLAKVPGLKVTARTSAFYFKGKDVPIPEIAAKLGVAYVVEGSVRKQGDKVRITAQLIKAADGFHVWSDTFTRDLKDIFAVQDEIAGLVAQNLQLKMELTPGKREVNPEAHRLVLEGRHYWNQRNTEGFNRAEAAFQKAIDLDSSFAEAYAGLAGVYAVRVTYQTLDQSAPALQAEIQRARAAAEKAVALAPQSAESQAVLAFTQFIQGEDAAAEAGFARALALNPNSVVTITWAGVQQQVRGRLDAAGRSFGRAAELDPLWFINLHLQAEVLYFAGRDREALRIAERSAGLRGDIFIPNLGLRAILLQRLGRTEEAMRLARQVRTHLDADTRWNADVHAIQVLRANGADAEAVSYASEVMQRLEPTSPMRGQMLAALGRIEEALPTLSSYHATMLRFLYWETVFDAWRDDSRFQAAISKLGKSAEYAEARASQARVKAAEGATP